MSPVIKRYPFSRRTFWRQKAVAVEIAFQVKIIGAKNLPPSLFSLKYNNKKKLQKWKIIPTKNLFVRPYL